MYCKCGCGGITNVSKYNDSYYNLKKGDHRRFIKWHQFTGKKMHKAAAWKGGKHFKSGYIMVICPEHPLSNNSGYIREHRLIAEKVMGKILPIKHPVHHLDGIKYNNLNNNLVVCESTGYHNLLHRRKRAYEASGDPNFFKCSYCKKYDSKINMYVSKDGGNAFHRKCRKNN